MIDLEHDVTVQEIDAAIERATLAAKVSGHTAPTREEAMKSMEDARFREEELKTLMRRLVRAAGYELNRQQAAALLAAHAENERLREALREVLTACDEYELGTDLHDRCKALLAAPTEKA